MPSTEDWYTVRISLPSARQVDCFCLIGIENADITIYHSDTGGDAAWTQLTGIDSYNDLEMRQSECWGRVVSKKFITFTAQTKRYWRFDFAAVAGLPFFGLISTIMGGVHYEMETPLGVRFNWRNRSPGASSGGLWHSEFRDDPVFPSMPFIFDYAPFNDLAETQQMIRERTNGDPIAIQFNPFYHPDFYLAYGVIADDSEVDPVILEDQTNISFRVNVLEPSRSKGYLV